MASSTAFMAIMLPISMMVALHLAMAAPATAPAPSGPPAWQNLTQVLVSAGYLREFVNIVASQTNVAEEWQRFIDASNSTGATIFAPQDSAFQSPQVAALLADLSSQNLTQLLRYHSLPIFHSYKDLQLTSFPSSLTFASASSSRFLLNITNNKGGVTLQSSITIATVSSNYYNEFPLSVFAIDQILLPVEIFGSNLTITPAPSPSPSPSPSSPSPEAPAPSTANLSTIISPPPALPSSSPLAAHPNFVFAGVLVLFVLCILHH